MKTLFYNGIVYLGNKKFVDKFIVENNKFFLIGNKCNDYLNDCEIKVDLKNKVVVPGLIDTHCHFTMTATNLFKPNLNKCKSIKEIIDTCKQYILKKPNNDFYYFEGWNENNFSNDNLLTKHDVDKICDAKPIYLFRTDRHQVVCNTIALKEIGYLKKSEQGILKESDANLVWTKINSCFSKENKDLIMNLINLCNSYGLTTIYNCDLLSKSNTSNFDVYYELQKEKKLNMRFNHQVCAEDNNFSLIEKYIDENKNSKFNNINTIKLFADGSLGSKTAHVSFRYQDNSSGYLNYQNKELIELVRKCNDEGFQVVIHAIGDKAIQQVIDTYSIIDKQNTMNNGIIHCELLNKQMIKQIKENNILVYVQPCFLEEDIQLIKSLKDYENISKLVIPLKTMSDNDIDFVFGTDSPICDINPWKNIYYGLERKQINTNKFINKKECIDIYKAIDAYSINSTIVTKNWINIGRIQEGFWADFTVLNQNIFELKNNIDILKTKSLKTFINGKLVFEL